MAGNRSTTRSTSTTPAAAGDDTTTTAAPATPGDRVPATPEQVDAGVPGGTTVRTLETENAELRDQLAAQPDDDGAPAVDRVRQLEAENAELRDALARAGVSLTGRRTPRVPSFGISEGVRLDVEMHGKATDPATGRVVTRADVKANDQRRRDAKAITDAALADK